MPPCHPPVAAVTVQIPFELEHYHDDYRAGTRPLFEVFVDGVGDFWMEGDVSPEQVRIVRDFDTVLPATPRAVLGVCTKSTDRDNRSPGNLTGMPCPPVVKHADGSAVTQANPAKAGEELVAYAVGLGRTSPASETGKVVRSSAPTIMEFTMDFNYRRNALGTRPLPADAADAMRPIYSGSLVGSVGMYEVRFAVPPVPPGTPPCDSLEDPRGLPRENIVYSNLTFSIGGRFSFDGAGICVAVEDESEPEKEPEAGVRE